MVKVITPNIGTVGTIVTIKGDGYMATEGIRIDFGTTKSITFTTTDVTGYFETTFTIDTQPEGITTVRAWGLRSKTNPYLTFDIKANIFFITPTIGPVSTVVTIKGNGYGASELVVIGFGWTPTITVISTGADGRFSTVFTVDSQPIDYPHVPKLIVGTGTRSGEFATSSFKIIARISKITPSIGTVGKVVTVYGDGHIAEQDIVIFFGTKQQQEISGVSAKCSLSGTYSITFTIETQPYGTTTVRAHGETKPPKEDAINYLNIIANITAVSPNRGPVGTIVTVMGNGYGSSEFISVKWSDGRVMATTTTNVDGEFITSFEIQPQQNGTNTITAVGSPSTASAINFFEIITGITLVSPTQGTIGNIITVAGTGFNSLETIRIDFGGVLTIAITSSDRNGSFSVTFTTQDQPNGNIRIKATDERGNYAYNDYTPYFVLGAIVITPTSGTVGSVITLHGTGYAVTQNIEVWFGDKMNYTGTQANLVGTFHMTFTVDTQIYDIKTVKALGRIPRWVEVDIPFMIIPRIYVVPVSGSVGDIVTVFGTGYGKSESVVINFGRTSTIITTTSNTIGTFTISFIIDTQPVGSTTITGIGVNTGGSAITYCWIFKSLTYLSPTIGTIGTLVTIRGNGYDISETIQIDFGTTKSITLVTSDYDGTFEAIFTVDTQYLATRTVRAYGIRSGQEENGSFKIIPHITAVCPSFGTIGARVTIYGDGYGSKEKVVVGFGTFVTIPGFPYMTSLDGTFTTKFEVPAQPYGTTTIIATGSDTAESDIDFFYIRTHITEVQPQFGTVGQSVTIKGNGYGRSELLQIDFGTTKSITFTTTNVNGEFTAVFTVDTQRCGTTTITATGLTIQQCDIDTFRIDSEITLYTPTSGSVGTYVTIEGTGFGASEMIRISLGNTITLNTVISNVYGSFTTIFTINVQPWGTKTVTIRGLESGRLHEYSEYPWLTFRIIPHIILVSPNIGTVGTYITVIGNGFGASEEIAIDFGTNDWIEEKQVLSTNEGVFTFNFTIDTQPYGLTTICAWNKGLEPRVRTAFDYFFITSKIISLEPKSGPIEWTRVTIVGDGYGATEVVRISFGSNVSIAFVTTNACGTFSTYFTVDTQPALLNVWNTNPLLRLWGSKTVTALGLKSGGSYSVTFKIKARVAIVSPPSGTVGTQVTVFGDGYGYILEANKGEDIRIKFGINDEVQATYASPKGTYSYSFVVNTQPGGTTTIAVRGANMTYYTCTGTFYIEGHIPYFEPTSGMVGQTVTIKGDGFGANECVIVDFGTTYTITTITASSLGTFALTFTADIQSAGTKTVVVRGVRTQNQDVGYFIINRGITLYSPTVGTVGTRVTIEGCGFVGSETIEVGFGINPLIATTTVLYNGAFSLTFTVDTQTYEEAGKIVTIKGSITPGTITKIFYIVGNITLVSPDFGTIGTIVTVEGDGFKATENIDINFGETGRITWTYTSSKGTFATIFTVDTQSYGVKTVAAVSLLQSKLAYCRKYCYYLG